MNGDSVSEYLQQMQSSLQSPIVEEHFADDYAPEKEEHRMEAIRAFSMSQIANAPSIFRHCLTSQHISQCLTTIVPVAFSS